MDKRKLSFYLQFRSASFLKQLEKRQDRFRKNLQSLGNLNKKCEKFKDHSFLTQYIESLENSEKEMQENQDMAETADDRVDEHKSEIEKITISFGESEI